MPDITLCNTKTCPSRKTCYRFMAIPDTWQSYTDFAPKKGDKKCEHYWGFRQPKQSKTKS